MWSLARRWRGAARCCGRARAALALSRSSSSAASSEASPPPPPSMAPRESRRERRDRKERLEQAPRRHFRVCLVGRPNVGKSTLFNRLVGPHAALVSRQAGTTRDRKEGMGRLGGLEFTVIDTGGYESSSRPSEPQYAVNEQMRKAVLDSDAVLFLVDLRSGVTSQDVRLAEELKRLNPSICTVVINKTEGLGLIDGLDQLYSSRFGSHLDAVYDLGFSRYLALSAEHGEGLPDLYDVLKPLSVASTELASLPASTVQIAILGRPNSGKSTLLNAILKEERVITSDVPGTTRDSIQASLCFRERDLVIVDTAGIRSAAKRRADPLEDLSVHSAWKSLGSSHIGVLLLDGSEQLSHAEQSIASNVRVWSTPTVPQIVDEGRGLVLALNKGDLLPDASAAKKQLLAYSHEQFPDLGRTPSLVISAKDGRGVESLLDACLRVHDAWAKRIGTGLLNRWLQSLTKFNPPPATHQRPLRVKYLTQVSSRPPTFALFCNRDEVPAEYERFLKSRLREEFGFDGVPLRFLVRRASNPFD